MGSKSNKKVMISIFKKWVEVGVRISGNINDSI